jgi:hypothetical protein
MAWQEEHEYIDADSTDGLQRPMRTRKTGKGYCGHMKNGGLP